MNFFGYATFLFMAILAASDARAASYMVKDINPSGPSYPQDLLDFNGALFFRATDGVNGYELWKSDGTADGTVMVRDINPTGSSGPYSLIVFNGTLFFFAYDGANYALWKSDGTETGTIPVSVVSGYNLVECNGALFFSTDYALWKTDGTDAGTVMVHSFPPDVPGNFLVPEPLSELTVAGGSLYFMVSSQLWKSDGTDAGTVLLATYPRGHYVYRFPGNYIPIYGDEPRGLRAFNGYLYFEIPPGEVWRCDGTVSGLVKTDLIDGANTRVINGTLYFLAYANGGGYELFRSYGTRGSTALVKDIFPGSESSQPSDFIAIDSNVFWFAAYENVHGREVWGSDGTAAGTHLVEDVSPWAGGIAAHLTRSGQYVFLSTDDGVNGAELWAIPLPASTPPAAPPPLTIKALKIKLDFASPGKDTLLLSAGLTSAPELFAKDKTLLLDIGGVLTDFTLDDKGSSAPSKTARFKIVPENGVQNGAAIKYIISARLTKGSFAPPLRDEGLTGSSSVKKSARTLRVRIISGDTIFQTDYHATYTSTAKKHGSAH
jgi:ELWxxDGT repeat protein